MKLNTPIITRLLSWPISILIRCWMWTLRYRIWYHDPDIDPAVLTDTPHIYLMWHEYTLIPLYLRGNCNVTILISQHRDADILNRVANIFGIGTVRGSSFRGGSSALKKLTEVVKTEHLSITPDGPRGPRRKMAQGSIYLSSKLGVPIVCCGLAYHKPWRLGSWDRFAIPRPFHRSACIMDEAIQVPPDLDRAGIEEWRVKVEDRLNELTEEAQQWADSGEQRTGQQPMRSQVGYTLEEHSAAIDKHNRAA